MPLEIKIKNYDDIIIPSGPLSSSASLQRIYISRSESKTFLQTNNSDEYNYEENLYEAELFGNELNNVEDVLQIEVSAFATYTMFLDEEDLDETSYVLVITSEDKTTTTKIRILIKDMGPVSTNLRINKVEDSNYIFISANYYAEVPVTVNDTTLDVGIVEVAEFDNSFEYFNVDVLTNDSDAIVSMIAKTENVDPDLLQTYSKTLEPFNLEEDIVLDDRFVYLKIYSISYDQTIYLKLVQNISVDNVTEVERLKKVMSNKWYYLYHLSTAFDVSSEITAEQLIEAEFFTEDELRTFLDDTGTVWYDISGYYEILVDSDETESNIKNQRNISYNLSGIQKFLSSDVENLGASIASDLYDIIVASSVSEDYIKSQAWLKYVRDEDITHICSTQLSEFELFSTLQKAKTEFLEEFSYVSVVYELVNSRYLTNFLRKLKYVNESVISGTLEYSVSSNMLGNIIQGLSNMINLSNDTAALNAYTSSFVDVLFNNLENLKIRENSIQRIEWVNT